MSAPDRIGPVSAPMPKKACSRLRAEARLCGKRPETTVFVTISIPPPAIPRIKKATSATGKLEVAAKRTSPAVSSACPVTPDDRGAVPVDDIAAQQHRGYETRRERRGKEAELVRGKAKSVRPTAASAGPMMVMHTP